MLIIAFQEILMEWAIFFSGGRSAAFSFNKLKIFSLLRESGTEMFSCSVFYLRNFRFLFFAVILTHSKKVLILFRLRESLERTLPDFIFIICAISLLFIPPKTERTTIFFSSSFKYSNACITSVLVSIFALS